MSSDSIASPDTLVRREVFPQADSVRAALNAQTWAQTAVARRPASLPGHALTQCGTESPISRRERQIVALIAQGFRNREVADELFISEQTVKNHMRNIFQKLGVQDRLELALYAVCHGLHITAFAG